MTNLVSFFLLAARKLKPKLWFIYINSVGIFDLFICISSFSFRPVILCFLCLMTFWDIYFVVVFILYATSSLLWQRINKTHISWTFPLSPLFYPLSVYLFCYNFKSKVVFPFSLIRVNMWSVSIPLMDLPILTALCPLEQFLASTKR